MAFQNGLDLPSIPPTPPDFYFCDRIYGEVTANDCLAAARQMPRGADPVTWTRHLTDPHHLEWMGNCIIQIGLGGFYYQELSRAIRPDTFRGMAGWLIDECATGPGIGGMVTFGMGDFLGWITRTDDVFQTTPMEHLFFTVSIRDPTSPVDLPASEDPAIGEIIAATLRVAAGRAPPGSALQRHYQESESRVAAQILWMSRGGNIAWFEVTLGPKEGTMTYVCDPNLGAPTQVDCSKLEYAQLGASSDNLHVGPGVVKFLSSETCNVAITATRALTLNWAQIKTAIASLSNICVSHPLHPPRGGRAYYGAQNPVSISGRRVKKIPTLTGLNALPPHANVTIFQQIEPIPQNPAAEMRSCTWRQVLSGGNIASCAKGPKGQKSRGRKPRGR